MTTYLSSNPSDTLVAGLLIGAVFGLVVAGLCWLVHELWSEYCARAAVATVSESDEARDERMDTHWSSTIRDHAEPFRERLSIAAQDAEVIDLQEAIADAFNRAARSASQKGGR